MPMKKASQCQLVNSHRKSRPEVIWGPEKEAASSTTDYSLLESELSCDR